MSGRRDTARRRARFGIQSGPGALLTPIVAAAQSISLGVTSSIGMLLLCESGVFWRPPDSLQVGKRCSTIRLMDKGSEGTEFPLAFSFLATIFVLLADWKVAWCSKKVGLPRERWYLRRALIQTRLASAIDSVHQYTGSW
ncbi:hypothetical protein ACLKA7_001798 [Drosophila subpalustris]